MKKVAQPDRAFGNILIQWYEINKRDLPWRQTRDPYKIWLSEIILQQTRVNQGLNYYLRFCELFPSVHHLANATEDEVLKAWQGLGYYSRARNLHHTAKVISHELAGRFPQDINEIQKLKGIGQYTAAAIVSFCFGIPAPVLDGNAIRVLCRIFGIHEPSDDPKTLQRLTNIASSLIPLRDPARFNQGIMELGATVCAPKKPNCEICPFNYCCAARKSDMTDEIPYKSKKTAVKEVWFQYAVLRYKNRIWLRKRSNHGIWKNLYDFPGLESSTPTKVNSLPEYLKEAGLYPAKATIEHISGEFIHLLTHRKIHAHFVCLRCTVLPKLASGEIFEVELENLNQFALPKLIEKYLIGRNMLQNPAP